MLSRQIPVCRTKNDSACEHDIEKVKKTMRPISDRTPDIEVVFRFNGRRKRMMCDGYRPAHLVTSDYLTTGVHHYFGTQAVSPDGEASGTITFLSPELYPNSMWVGKIIDIQEGNRIIGQATVTRVLNPLLYKKEKDYILQ